MQKKNKATVENIWFFYGTKAILRKHTSHIKSWQNRKDIYVAYMHANAAEARLFYIYTRTPYFYLCER